MRTYFVDISVKSVTKNNSTGSMMNLLLTQWSALFIGIGSLICATWLWSGIGDWCREYWEFLRKAALIDGPRTLPIIGNALYFIGDKNEYLKKIMILAKTYTTSLRVWLGPRLIVVISNPSDIEILMKSPHGKQKSSEYRFIEKGTGPGLITLAGPMHKIHRNLIMPMVNGKVLNVFLNSFETQTQRCVECLESRVNREDFDIRSFADNWSLDIVLDTIIGVPGTFQQGEYIELRESILEFNSLTCERIPKVWLYPDWIYSLTTSGKKYNKGIEVVRKFIDDTIKRKKKEYHDSKNSCDSLGLEQSALVDQLIAYNEEHKLMDDIHLRAEIFTMIIAAQDPPTTISSFIFLMLAMHPGIQDKVRAEVQEIIGDGDITTRNVAQLKYLGTVINETQRLFPIMFIVREVTDDVEFSSFTAPKGCSVAMFMFKTHRDPNSWKEPNKFDPDRFLPENSVGRHPYAFLPFSSGIRGCIGKHYATIMIKTLVIGIVRKYRLHSKGSLENLRLTSNLFTQSLDGFKISISRL